MTFYDDQPLLKWLNSPQIVCNWTEFNRQASKLLRAKLRYWPPSTKEVMMEMAKLLREIADNMEQSANKL